jgi:hypothetical protein
MTFPKTKKELQKLGGTVNYLMTFILNFAQKCQPLYELLKTTKYKIAETEESKRSFIDIQEEINRKAN